LYGLVLEGGGCKGSYQAGACKALHELGIKYSCVAGTSVGALNGAMVVQGDIQRLYDLWYNIKPSKVFRMSDEESRILNTPGMSRDLIYVRLKRIRRIIADRGLDIKPLLRMVRNTVDEEKIRNSPVCFGIVTFDIRERMPLEIYKEDIPKGKLADYLIASARIPGFQSENIDGRVYIDGGIYNTLPINLVIDKGCSDIITIRTFGYGRLKRVDTAGLNIKEISPVENLGPILDFSTERARKNLKLGYFDAVRIMKGLKGRKFYVKNLNGEEFFLNYLMSLSDKKIARVANLFGIDRKAGKRLLFENIVPMTAEILNISGDTTYEELSLGLLENLAESVGVERFRIYNIEEFISEIAEKYKNLTGNTSAKDKPGFIRRIEFLSGRARHRIINSLAGEIFDDLIKQKQ